MPDAPRELAALIFDFDGLILDTETCTYQSVAEVFIEHGLTLDVEWWHSIIGSADHPHWTETLADALGRPVDRSTLVTRGERRRRAILEGEPIRPGILELLDGADAAGLATTVVSSSSLDWVGMHLARLGLGARFRDVVTRDDVGGDATRTKPAPDLFLLAAKRLGVDPGTCAVLEDSPNGVAAARAAGMVVVAVPGPMTEGLRFERAHLEVGSAADLDVPRLRALVRVVCAMP